MTMNGVPQVGPQNFDNNPVRPSQAPQAGEEQAPAASGDQVELSPEKSTIKKIGEAIIDFPVKVLEVGLSTTLGAAYAAKNVVPGALEGVNEGVADYKGRGRSGWFTVGTIGEFVAAGAATGLVMGGPVTSGIGAGIGLITGLIVRGLESITGADDVIVENIEKKVDKAIEDNTGGTAMQLATRNATEGFIEGGIVGGTAGWHLGKSLGKGLVAGIRGVADGAKEGIFGK
ncbi:MAG: hypothetical protein RDV48_02575 [Candidatus Eremiobacteraeota bacterium]|nr:hypothetical protein [Candidatus Eremiobacteraeota bacterium]